MSTSEEFEDLITYDTQKPARRRGLVKRFFAWIAWTLWGKRRWLKEQDELYARQQMLAFVKGQLTHDNRELMLPIKYDDMHLEHYQKMHESLPVPVLPPPDYEDDLN